jgi:probable rRNA maturation factor
MSSGPLVLLRNDQTRLSVDELLLREMLAKVFLEAGFTQGEVSVAIVDAATIHRLNREFLAHDYPTDVISFVYASDGERLEGEIIASADYALQEAMSYNWPAEQELLLYVVHGALHLIGYDDLDPASSTLMRQREREVLLPFGLVPPGRE